MVCARFAQHGIVSFGAPTPCLPSARAVCPLQCAAVCRLRRLVREGADETGPLPPCLVISFRPSRVRVRPLDIAPNIFARIPLASDLESDFVSTRWSDASGSRRSSLSRYFSRLDPSLGLSSSSGRATSSSMKSARALSQWSCQRAASARFGPEVCTLLGFWPAATLRQCATASQQRHQRGDLRCRSAGKRTTAATCPDTSR